MSGETSYRYCETQPYTLKAKGAAAVTHVRRFFLRLLLFVVTSERITLVSNAAATVLRIYLWLHSFG